MLHMLELLPQFQARSDACDRLDPRHVQPNSASTTMSAQPTRRN